MLFPRARVPFLALCAVITSFNAFGQNVAYVGSSYPMPVLAAGGYKFNITLGLAYPANLPPASYISGIQLATDLVNLEAAYPNQNDPPEAILSSVLSNLLAKYPQVTGGTLAAGAVAGTIGPSLEVVIGTVPSSSAVAAARAPAAQIVRQPASAPKSANE